MVGKEKSHTGLYNRARRGMGWDRRDFSISQRDQRWAALFRNYPLCARKVNEMLRAPNFFTFGVCVWKRAVSKKSQRTSPRAALNYCRAATLGCITCVCFEKCQRKNFPKEPNSTNALGIAWHRICAAASGWDASLIFSLRKWSLTTLNFRRWLCCCSLCTSSCPTQRPWENFDHCWWLARYTSSSIGQNYFPFQ